MRAGGGFISWSGGNVVLGGDGEGCLSLGGGEAGGNGCVEGSGGGETGVGSGGTTEDGGSQNADAGGHILPPKALQALAELEAVWHV